MERQLQQPLERWPLRTWDFHNLTLAACYFSPELAAAQSQCQQAEAALAEAQNKPVSAAPALPLFPTEKLPHPFAIIAPEPVSPQLAHGTSANIKPSRRAQLIAETTRQAESARLRLQAIAWQVRANVRSNLVAYAALVQAEYLVKALEDTQAKLVDAGESRAATSAIGSDERLELSRLQLQLAQTRLVRAQTMLAKFDARAHLARSLSLPVGVLFTVEVDFDFSRPPALWGLDSTLSDLRWEALHNRSEMLNALAEYACAEDALRTELVKKHSSAQVPSGCRWDPQASRWVVMVESLGSDLPSAVLHGRTARAEARRLAAATRLLSLQAKILDEVEQSAAIYRVRAEDAGGVEALVTLLVRQYAAFQDRSEIGLDEQPETLLARMQLLAAGLSRLDAQAKLQSALGALEESVQLEGALSPARVLGQAPPTANHSSAHSPAEHRKAY